MNTKMFATQCFHTISVKYWHGSTSTDQPQSPRNQKDKNPYLTSECDSFKKKKCDKKSQTQRALVTRC